MKAPFLLTAAAAVLLAACGQPQEAPADADAPAAGVAETETAETGTETATEADGDAADEDAPLSPLDAAAEAACLAGGEGFAEPIPDGAAFASRGPDAVVRGVCNRDGETLTYEIATMDLTEPARMAFDGTVAEMFRHGARAGDDRSQSGFYRMRDGRFCAVQTDPALVAATCEAFRVAAEATDASAGE